jgi:putative component of membrane protein insertase Oxa1/YidC/SpoIIIJ protein YidD
MNRMKSRTHQSNWIRCFVILSMVLLSWPPAGRADQKTATAGVTDFSGTGRINAGAAQSVIGLFKRHISPIDGDRCPMYPSCSQYGRQAFDKHGFFMGWIMTCDRLLRCGRDERATAPRIVTENGPRYYDSVEDNDFWWAR